MVKIAEAHRMNFRMIDDHTLGISLDEATSESDVVEIWQVFKGNKAIGFTLARLCRRSRLSRNRRGIAAIRAHFATS